MGSRIIRDILHDGLDLWSSIAILAALAIVVESFLIGLGQSSSHAFDSRASSLRLHSTLIFGSFSASCAN
jgi:hypothetical protein